MADRASDNSSEHSAKLSHRLLVLIVFACLFGCAFLILFGCGQLALSAINYQAAPDTRSNLRADYSTWPIVMIPPIDPAIVEDIRHDEQLNPVVIGARPFWPTSDRPTATRKPTLIAQQPTSTPVVPTNTPTIVNTPTPTLQPTRTATPYPTRSAWPTSTATPGPTSTETPWPTATSQPPQHNTRTPTPTPVTPAPTTPTHTSTPTIVPVITGSYTPTDTPTPTSTPTDTPTPTNTPTDTPTPTDTDTPTSTATSTPSPTNTPQPCSGNMPPGEPNIGSPNGIVAEVQCGGYINIDLGSQRITSHPGYDLVDYESYSAACGGICLDWVKIDVCDAACSNWVTVFNWGDGLPDNNTNVGSFAAGGEVDNQPIPGAALHCSNGYCTGITIDVDAPGFPPVPPSGYRYIRIWSPINWPNNDGAEVDAIEVVP